MRVERIDTTDPAWIDDERLADYRVVRDPELVRRNARFLAEGRLVVRTLLRDSPLSASSLLLEEAALTWLVEQLGEDSSPDVSAYVVPSGAMKSLSGFRFHQGCLAVGERPAPQGVEELLAGCPTPPRLLVGLDAVSNPDNVGAIFRTAAAFGADGIVLSPECASPLYRKAIRTSMGAALRLPFVHGEAWHESLEALRRRGFTLLALTPAAPSRTLEETATDLRPGDKRALLMGAEGPGLGPVSLQLSEGHVCIPMDARVDSLNVAAAAAVALYRLRPQGTQELPSR